MAFSVGDVVWVDMTGFSHDPLIVSQDIAGSRMQGTVIAVVAEDLYLVKLPISGPDGASEFRFYGSRLRPRH